MKFFREKRVIEFDDKKVELYEINVKSLVKLANEEYKNNYELILDNSNLTDKDFENISIEALKKIEKEFLELNSKHFDSKGEKTDKKKS
jgi:AAA+ ATPase superfamily predicted ATPase